jgi:RNA polymerase sigma-70 factor (ECF subfamily)
VRCADGLIANDIFQDTWETVLRSVQNYTDSGQFKAWLFSIARSRLSDYYRNQPNPSLVVDIEDSDLQQLDMTDNAAVPTETLAELFGQTDKLLQVMTSLPATQQEAMSLYAVGLSVSEIADITGVNKETAKSRVRYARAKLIHLMQVNHQDSR